MSEFDPSVPTCGVSGRARRVCLHGVLLPRAVHHLPGQPHVALAGPSILLLGLPDPPAEACGPRCTSTGDLCRLDTENYPQGTSDRNKCYQDAEDGICGEIGGRTIFSSL